MIHFFIIYAFLGICIGIGLYYLANSRESPDSRVQGLFGYIPLMILWPITLILFFILFLAGGKGHDT